jgi:hypothetical protein
MGTGIAPNTAGTLHSIVFPVSMRTAPTSVDYSTLGLQDGVGSIIGVTSLTLTSAAQQGHNNGMITTVAGATTTQYRFYFLIANNSTSGYIGFSAEL